MLWVDKYRPHSLEEVDLYPDITQTLKRLADSRDTPHLLFYGPSGSGRKTRVMSMLQEVYGPSVYSLHLDHKTVSVTDSKSVDIAVLSSPYHLDINPSDAGNYDRAIVMHMIKEVAMSNPLRLTNKKFSGKLPLKEEGKENISFVGHKMVILNDVDKMTKGAQHALRRTMEKYMKNCRLVLICSSLSRLIAPLKSRCLGIRVPAHTEENLLAAVTRVCKGEGLPIPSNTFMSVLLERSQGNLRRALLMFEAAAKSEIGLEGGSSAISLPDWELFLQKVVDCIFAEQSPKALFDIRQMFYDLLCECVSGETILRHLVDGIVDRIAAADQPKVFQLAAKYDYNMRVGTSFNTIVHLEAFTAGVMQVLKASVHIK